MYPTKKHASNSLALLTTLMIRCSKHLPKGLITLLCILPTSGVWAQNTALDFDGQDDYVTLASLPDQWPSLLDNGFTISLQLQPRNLDSFGRILSIQQDGNNFATALIATTGRVFFYIYHDGVIYSHTTDVRLGVDVWHDLALRWEPGGSEVSIWLNGQDVTDNGGAGTSSDGNDNTFTLGSRTDGQQTLNGVLDGVRIWGTALDAGEIGQLANNYCLDTNNPLHVYDFEVGTAGADNTGLSTLPDRVGSNPGNLNGFDLVGSRSNWVEGVQTCADFDVAVSSTASAPVVAPSDQVTWSSSVSGDAAVPGATLPDVEITLPLPATLQFLSLTADPGFNCTTPAVGTSGNLSCIASGLIAPALYTFDVTTRVDSAATPNAVITPEWRIEQPLNDRLETNNTSATSIRVSNVLLLLPDDAVSMAETSVDIDVLANDTDSAGGAGIDPASLTLGLPATHGVASCSAGSCRYTPDREFSGTDSFRYRVCDASTSPVCDEAEVRVEVLPRPAPIAIPMAGGFTYLMMIIMISALGFHRLRASIGSRA